MILGYLGSGHLGYLVLQELLKEAIVDFVMTDRNSTDIIQFCERKEIKRFVGNPRGGKALNQLATFNCDLLVSVNYLFLVEGDVLELPKKMAINFHGSLLPKFRGRTPHVWAIINNEKETGVTAHLMSHDCDSGDIIAQVAIPILHSDTGDSLLKKYNNVYPKFVKEVIKSVTEGSYRLTAQDHDLATYFEKRTPADGLIDWNWQKERIYNWVRALAKPYPGAFTYHNGQKIIINEIQFSDFGFHCNIENGKILSFDNGVPIVKTSNGCIKLVQFESEHTLILNTILHK